MVLPPPLLAPPLHSTILSTIVHLRTMEDQERVGILIKVEEQNIHHGPVNVN